MGNIIEISVVIPCYNSENSLKQLCEEITEVVNKDSINFEVLLINDCSKDNTWEVIKSISQTNPNIKGINLQNNVGQFHAIMCGFEQSKGNFVVTMDDDLQHSAKDIITLYEALKTSPELDIVMGSYAKIKNHSIIRNIGSRIHLKISSFFMGIPPDIELNPFRCIRRPVVDILAQHKTKFPVIGPMLLSVTKRIKNTPISHSKRKYGKSNYSFYKLTSSLLDNIISSSSFPLKVIGLAGLCSFLLSIIIGIVLIIKYFFSGVNYVGWTSQILAINFYGGLTLFSIGLIGEYLIRLIGESKPSPNYFIRETTNI